MSFDRDGIAVVNGKPYFPVGVFTYDLNPAVLAELHEVQCNTVLHGFQPDQLDLLHEHGLMAVCATDRAWIDAAKNHPALLAWYLTDEPENRGVTPEGERERYLTLKAEDPDHPIGLCHTSFEALTTFKDACDFTMTDIYPITPKRDRNIMGVSIMMDEARRIHGPAWPQWTYIQTFGGPEVDNGVWAVPLPHEVRFMVYQALVHRATGILYFSYWPQAPRTWQEVGRINGELHRLIPWLVAPGREGKAAADDERVQVRVRLLGDSAADDGKSAKNEASVGGVAIAVNTSTSFLQTTINIEDAAEEIRLPFEGNESPTTVGGTMQEDFLPYGVHVYTWGPKPSLNRVAPE